MRVYIDEAGAFVVPASTKDSSYSLVLAVALPSSTEAELFKEYLLLRSGWPNPEKEIKGSKLNEHQAAQIISLISRYDVLVNYYAIDMASHGDRLVTDFKLRQAAAVVANLTSEHQSELVSQLSGFADYIRGMANQLFVQAFLTVNLVLEAVQELTLYYVQRQPRELGSIAWIVDRKDRTITQMEDMWTALILPWSESHFARKPLLSPIGADFSHFDARYGITPGKSDEEMSRHLEWLYKTYNLRPPSGSEKSLDAKRLLTEQLEFLDSRDSPGLQLADMLAAILRRALMKHLQLSGWQNFGRLLTSKPNSPFLRLGGPEGIPPKVKGRAAYVYQVLKSKAKPMIL
jgi:hypothetical protein